MPVVTLYAREPFPGHFDIRPSIMLLGPTPRSEKVASWRPKALSLLQEKKFWGYVVIPEDRQLETFDETKKNEQYRWEWNAIDRVRCTMFWIPRTMSKLPGLTTNIEIGWIAALYPRKTVIGLPPEAQHVGYIRQLAQERSNPAIPVFETLEKTVEKAIQLSLVKRYH